MADDTTLGVGIKANVQGQSDVKQLADSVAGMSDALRGLVSDAKAAASAMDKVERGAAGVTTSNVSAAKNIKATTEALREQGRVASGLAGTLANAATANARLQSTVVTGTYKASGPTGAAPSNVGVVTAQQRDALNATNAARELAVRLEKEATDEMREQLRLRREAVTAARNARLSSVPAPAQTGTGAGSAAAVAARMGGAGAFVAQDRQALADAKAALGSYNDQLANTRYAMYAFSNATGVAGAAMVALNVGVVQTAATFETLMANIERTSGLTGNELAALEDQFLQLGKTIPTSFQDLGKIAVLAGQLNIPAENIASFTSTIAQFTATTGVSVETSTTAFGRLDALLPDVKGNYEALGSSILNVGVNSVATEAEIISTTTQIAAAGAQAGLTADQVIGLAASYASLGIAPEAARGTTIRVFSEIGTAVTAGGEKLDTFAKLAGQSSEMFQKAWGQDAGASLIKVLQGLQKEGGNAETTIRGLGITAVRDINALLRLSQNVEIVGDNLGYAADGFGQATQLGDSFASIAETLAAKVQVLVNSFQALVAALGSQGVAVIGSIVEGLTGFANLLTDLAENPFVANIIASMGALSLFGGVVLIGVAALGHLTAAVLAGKPVWMFFKQQLDVTSKSLALIRSEAALTGETLSLAGAKARVAGRMMGGALLGLAGGAAAVGAIMAIGAAWDHVAKLMEPLDSKIEGAFGGLESLTGALEADTAAVRKGAEAYGSVTGTITSVTNASSIWKGTIDETTGSLNIANETVDASTSKLGTNTYSIGANTAALLANKLANDGATQSMLTRNAQLSSEGLQSLDTGGILTAAAKNDTAGARAIIDDYKAYISDAFTHSEISVFQRDEAYKLIKNAEDVSAVTTGALQAAANQTVINTAVNDAFGISSENAANAISIMGDEASIATGEVASLADMVAGGFSYQNTIAAFASDFYTMASAIYESGTSFSALDAVGQANLGNLQATIETSIVAGQAMGINAAESVGMVFAQLQRSGVDTANLLASLAGMGIAGVTAASVSGYMNGTTAFSAGATQMNAALTAMSDHAKKAAAAVGGGSGGGGGVGGAAKKAGKAAKAAAVEIRTLADYAGDLGKVFGRSFELRFSGQNGLDSIATGWAGIAKATADANKQIEESRVNMQQLASDKTIQEYFLGIANAYGDDLRAGDITAQIAKLNEDIAAEANKGAAAQLGASKELTGNSEAAIENRATLQGLVTEYQDYIESLASSGMSQADLQAKTLALKAEFEAQAAALGFNAQQVQAYSASFTDMTTIIAKVPRNVNVTTTVNNNPALTALAEFEAAAKRSGAAAGAGAGAGISNGVRNAVAGLGGLVLPPITIPPIKVGYKLPDYSTMMAMQATIRAQTNDPNFRIALGPGSQGGQTFYGKGGYTGNYGVKEEAGIVHGQEYVINAKDTARLGLPFLNALNSGQMPTSGITSTGVSRSANSGVQVVELSSYDRSLLAAAGNVKLQIGNKDIADATSQSNLVSAKRGTN